MDYDEACTRSWRGVKVTEDEKTAVVHARTEGKQRKEKAPGSDEQTHKGWGDRNRMVLKLVGLRGEK